MHNIYRVGFAAIVASFTLTASASASSSVEMRFVFGAPDAVKASPEVIDQILQPSLPGGGNDESPGGDLGGNPGGEGSGEGPGQPTETGRTVDTENAACDPGQSGQKLRTRIVVFYSDGSTEVGAWSRWNASACVTMQPLKSVAYGEFEACPAGMYGSKQSFGKMNLMPGGDFIVVWEYQNYDNGCKALSSSGARTYEWQSKACDPGYFGYQRRSRAIERIWSGIVYSGWSAWTSSCASIR